ncbi:unnamed protein product, partial [Closterium sp. Yama58-4]
MDSIALERERGITIASKYTSVTFTGTTLNLVDTPGHADFAGEVERVMGMVDGALLLVDVAEGPLAQTKFVLGKALQRGLKPIVVLNKCDRPSGDFDKVSAIDPPTIAMTFSVNDSPLAGRHGTQMTGPKIGARLKAEVATNVSLGMEAGPSADAFKVLARGEMQLGVLIESMRREGFELSISPPSVVYREEGGKKLEQIEELMVEVDEEFTGAVIDAISLRKGELLDMITESTSSSSSSSDSSSSVADSAASATSPPSPSTSLPSSLSSASSSLSRTRLLFTCPSRGLLGVRGVLNTATRGTAVLHRSFLRTITALALSSLEARGTLFVSREDETYDRHLIGENARDDDME